MSSRLVLRLEKQLPTRRTRRMPTFESMPQILIEIDRESLVMITPLCQERASTNVDSEGTLKVLISEQPA